MKEKFEQIEDYLAGNLDAEARRQFEEALRTDPELASEVAVYRDMAAALAPRPEDALRASLDRLGAQFVPGEKKSRKTLLQVLLLLTGIALIYFLVRSERFGKNTPAPQDIHRDRDSSSNPGDRQQTPPDTTRDQPATPPENQPPHGLKKMPMAGNFKPNGRLEDLVGSHLRSGDYTFEMEQPDTFRPLKWQGAKSTVQFSGVLHTDSPGGNLPAFRLLLFSNKPSDYENFHSLYSSPLQFEPEGKAFRFRLQARTGLAPGLYYYLIEDMNTGAVHYAGKFRLMDEGGGF